MRILKELTPIYNKRDSFHQKAMLLETKKNIILLSYGTEVVKHSKEKGTIKINGYYSPTTLRHINEYLLQNGYDKISKEQCLKKPLLRTK